MVAPTGITITFDGDGSGLRESRPVVARIFGFADGSEEPVSHEMVVPAGQTIEQPLGKGLYSVELTLSSGRIIQRNVRVNEDSNETFRFLDDLAEQSSFSLQDAVTQSGRRIFAEAAAAAAVQLSPTVPEPQHAPAPPEPGGLEGIVRRFRKRPPAALSVRPRLATPTAATLAIQDGWTYRSVSEPPEAPGWKDIAPVERDGARALWRIRDDSFGPRTKTNRKWARIARADGGTEIASLPLPWVCTESRSFADAEILVDPDRYVGAATRVAVNDLKLAGLLAFLDQGQAGAARPMLEALEQNNVIEQTVYSKMSNPLAACAAAYVGLAVYPAKRRERWDEWLRNCMDRFPDVPDAAIVHARRLVLRPGNSDDQILAAAALRKACAAGIPYFSAGVFLLREMLLQLSAENADFSALAEETGRLASRVDASQIFTVLRFAPSRRKMR